MRVLASVRLRAFAYPTEDEAKVKGALESLAPGVGFEERKVDATHGGAIRVFEARLTRRKEIEAFLRSLSPGVRETLAAERAKRTDESGHLFFRLDKQELVLGRQRLAGGGDTVVVECAVHGPRSRAAEAIEEALRGGLSRPGERGYL